MGCEHSDLSDFPLPRCFGKGKSYRSKLPTYLLSTAEPTREINTSTIDKWYSLKIQDERGRFFCYCCGDAFDDLDALFAHLTRRRGVSGEQSPAATAISKTVLVKLLLVLDFRYMKSAVGYHPKTRQHVCVHWPKGYEWNVVEPPATIVNSSLVEGCAAMIMQRASSLTDTDITIFGAGRALPPTTNVDDETGEVNSTKCPHCGIFFATKEELAFHLASVYESPTEAGRVVVQYANDKRTAILKLLGYFVLKVTIAIKKLTFYACSLPSFDSHDVNWLTLDVRNEVEANKVFLLVGNRDPLLPQYAIQAWRPTKEQHRCPHCGKLYSNRSNMVAHYIRYMCPDATNLSQTHFFRSIVNLEQPFWLPLPDGTFIATLLMGM